MLVQGETRHRLSWPIGVVKQVFPSRDGVVRAVEIKTSKGLLTRSIQRLHVLGIASDIRNHTSVARLGLQEDSPAADATDMTSGGGESFAELEQVGGMDQSDELSSDSGLDNRDLATGGSQGGGVVVQTRCGRVVKKPGKLNLWHLLYLEWLPMSRHYANVMWTLPNFVFPFQLHGIGSNKFIYFVMSIWTLVDFSLLKFSPIGLYSVAPSCVQNSTFWVYRLAVACRDSECWSLMSNSLANTLPMGEDVVDTKITLSDPSRSLADSSSSGESVRLPLG